MRLKILRLIILGMFAVLATALVYFQLIRGHFFYGLSTNNRVRAVSLEAQRGRILDRTGRVIADSRLSFDVVVLPQDAGDPSVLFGYLSQVLRAEKDVLLARYQQRRRTPFAPVVVAEDVDQKAAMVLEENRYRFPGLRIQEAFRRWYPLGEAGAHVLGYVGKIDSARIKRLKHYGYTQQSLVGYSGVEEFYDRYLMGIEGGLQIEVDSRGRQVRILSIRQPERGRDVELTIDIRMQEMITRAFDQRPGAAVLLDLDSGEILALVSSPSFDLNVFADVGRSSERARLFRHPDSPVLNRAIRGQYPPGSIFKVVVSAAGLMERVFDRNTTFSCPGYFELGKARFRCTKSHGSQNVIEALAHSCNVYYYNAGLLIGPDVMHRYARLFGFGLPTHVDLPGEEPGFVPSSKKRLGRQTGWYKGDTVNFSIGQGDVLATPLQAARMMAAVARDGRMIEPRLLKSIGGQTMVMASGGKDLGLRREVLQIVQQGLRAAVAAHDGTARLLNMPGFEIYGKTGTAQSVPGKESHAWFAGYNVQGKRRVAFCVLLEHGGSSANAVGLTAQILTALRQDDLL